MILGKKVDILYCEWGQNSAPRAEQKIPCLNNVKIGQGKLQLIMKHILFYQILGLGPFWLSDLKQLNEYSIKQPSDL